jgi:hypothetical protein
LAAAPATAAAAPGGATVFVQSAKSGKVGGGRLLLTGVSGRVSWATNSGRSGAISIRRLHRQLIRPRKPATGTLHIAGQRGGQELTFRLSRPRYNAARHTVAYRAKPLPKRRAARAAGFRRPRRFGAASLSIIPHPTLMGASDPTVNTCSATITNLTSYELVADGSLFSLVGKWDPVFPATIPAGSTATWAADPTAENQCVNTGWFVVADAAGRRVSRLGVGIAYYGAWESNCRAFDNFVCAYVTGAGGGPAHWKFYRPL